MPAAKPDGRDFHEVKVVGAREKGEESKAVLVRRSRRNKKKEKKKKTNLKKNEDE